MRSSTEDTENDEKNETDFDNSDMIINKMANLYAEKIMSDIILIVNNVEYPSHKLILCASSDVFQIMLHDSKWSESSEKKVTLGETPSCAAVFEDFLKYLYTGKIHLDFASVVPIVSLADKYNVKDLLKIGLDYMERNVSLACKKNQVVSWFQLTLASGHSRVSDLCSNFIKANFAMVAKTIDFPNMEPELLVTLIRCNDLVIHDEYKLFECISSWLTAKKCIMESSGEENIDYHFDRYVNAVMPYVRFPMMTPNQLVELLLHPLSQTHQSLIVDKIRAALNFHKGEEIHAFFYNQDNRLFTPRLYTTEKFCASLCIDHLSHLPTYHSRSLLFSSQKYIASDQEQLDWSVDLYPKGVWFRRCLTVYMPPGLEVPERVLRTVRMSVTTKNEASSNDHEEIRVKIGILVMGSNQDHFHHVRCVKTRNYIFSADNQIVNFDDIIDHDELLLDKPKSPYLIGSNKDQLQILVTITPLSKYSSLSIS